MILFKEKNNSSSLGVLDDIGNIRAIKHSSSKPSKIFLENGNYLESECIRCSNPKCISFQEEEYTINELSNFPNDKSAEVCPTSAISLDKNGVPVISEKCISCGLCAIRCPLGAIFFRNGRFIVNASTANLKVLPIEKRSLEKQDNQIKNILGVKHTGQILDNSDSAIQRVYENPDIKRSPNIFIRNILLCLKICTMSKRIGDVYTRMDLVFKYTNKIGEVEVEFGNDTLSATRKILDDIAILSERYNIGVKYNIPLIVTLYLPHKRQGVWQIIKDIKNVLDISVNTVSLGSLLVLMWNFKDFNPENFYIDFDKMSLKGVLTSQNNIELPRGEIYSGIFEPER